MHIRLDPVCSSKALLPSHHSVARPHPQCWLRTVSWTVATITVVPSFLAAPVLAQDVAAAFDKSCAGCHVGGGNILGGRTLKLTDLEATGLTEIESLSSAIYSGNKRMPGFGELCAPRGQCTFGPRLSDDEIRSLAEFVLDQAQKGWK